MMVRKTADMVVAGFKNTPVALAVILLNVMFVGFATYIAYRVSISNEQQRGTIEYLVKACVSTYGPR